MLIVDMRLREVLSLECDGCGEVLKEEAAALLLLLKNEDDRTTEGMIANSILLAAVLTVASVVSLSLLSVLCLRCKRKSKIIHEEHQIYDPQTFQRGGSVFAVMKSKTVTRTNQISSTTFETYEEDFIPGATDEQSDYENVTDAQIATDSDHTYVDPLPASLYVNEHTQEKIINADKNPDIYANMESKDDDDDYENVNQDDDDEPDYVNENGQCA